jgi:hypothetical protein
MVVLGSTVSGPGSSDWRSCLRICLRHNRIEQFLTISYNRINNCYKLEVKVVGTKGRKNVKKPKKGQEKKQTQAKKKK